MASVEDIMREMARFGFLALPGSPETAFLEKIRNKEQLLKQHRKMLDRQQKMSNIQKHQERLQNCIPAIQAQRVASEEENREASQQKALDVREMERLHQDSSHLYKSKASMHEKKNKRENYNFRADKKMEVINARLNWDQKRLEAWTEQMAHSDENLMALNKYTKEDDNKIRELTLGLEKLSVEVCQKKNALHKESTKATVVQMVENKILKAFNQHQNEKQQLLSMWEASVNHTEKKDQNLLQQASLLEQRKAARVEQKALMKKLEEFNEREVQNNKEIQKKIEENKRDTSKMQQYQKEESNCAQLKDEMLSLKAQCGHVGRELEDMRSNVRSKKEEAKSKASKLQELQMKKAPTNAMLLKAIEKGLSAKGRNTQVEKHHREEEKAFKAFDIKLQQVKKVILEKKMERKMLQDEVIKIKADISGGHSALAHQRRNSDKMKQHIGSRMDYQKKQKLQICRIEEKLAHRTGNLDKEQNLALENQVSLLRQNLEKKKKTAAEIMAHFQKFQCEMCSVKKRNEKIEVRLKNSEAEDLDLINDSVDKELKGHQRKKQGVLLNINIMQLEVNRAMTEMEKMVSHKRYIEMRILERQTAIMVRKEEVSMCKDMARKHNQILQKELHSLRLHFNTQSTRLENKRAKYQIICTQIGIPEDQICNVLNDLFIERAQNMGEKVQKRENLLALTEKGETETVALRNTLWLFSMGADRVKQQGKEGKEKQKESHRDYPNKLKQEARIKAISEKVEFSRQQIKELKENTEDLSIQLETLRQEVVDFCSKHAELNKPDNKQKKKYNSKKERLDKANKRLSMLLRKIHASRKGEKKTLKVCRPFMKKVGKCGNLMPNMRLLATMDKNLDLEELVHTYFTKAGVPVPRLPFHVPSQRRTKQLIARNSSLSTPGQSVPSTARGSTVDLGCEGPASSKLSPREAFTSENNNNNNGEQNCGAQSLAPSTPGQSVASSARGSAAPAKRTADLGRGGPASHKPTPRAFGNNNNNGGQNGGAQSLPPGIRVVSVPSSARSTVGLVHGGPAFSKPLPRASGNNGGQKGGAQSLAPSTPGQSVPSSARGSTAPARRTADLGRGGPASSKPLPRASGNNGGKNK